MSNVTVSVRLVDGGLQEWQEGPDLLVRLQNLRRRGLEGKQLIHELLTDDWAAPPRVVIISGVAPDGQRLEDILIPYV
jgi:hypothetical protein